MITAARQIAGEDSDSLACIANGLLVCIAKERIDDSTLAKVEEKLDLSKVYTWNEFKEQLEKHANQMVCSYKMEPQRYTLPQSAFGVSANPLNNKRASPEMKCTICQKAGHKPYFCPDLEPLSTHQKHELVMKKALCYNCLQLMSPVISVWQTHISTVKGP